MASERLRVIRALDSLDSDRLNADVCVIGAGAAGITIACELDGRPLQVVVLESGFRHFDQRTQELYRSEVVGLAHGGIHEQRVRTFGGTTTRWAGQGLPMFDIDFARRDWVSRSGWPLSRDELDPYYRRAGDLLGLTPFARRATDNWPSVIPPPPAFDGELIEPIFTQYSQRPDFARTYGGRIAASKNVQVVLGANVTELVADPAATSVDCAWARGLDGRELTVTAQLFVVCCGGIETARLLLASDRHADGGLGNSRDLVGRCFLDHPTFSVGAVQGSDLGPLRKTFGPRRESGVKYLSKFRASDALQRAEGLLHAGGEIVFAESHTGSIAAGKVVLRSIRRPELRRQALGGLGTIVRDPMPLLRAATRYYIQRQPALETSGTPTLSIGCEQAPNLSSRVLLSREQDELGMRRSVLDWRLTEQDLRTLRRFSEVAANELERLELGSVAFDERAIPDDPDEVSNVVFDFGHHMGTTRMASSPEDGVVDEDCRVFGLDNLHVASCSVFPTSGISSPTFTLLALALRLADDLEGRLAGRAAA